MNYSMSKLVFNSLDLHYLKNKFERNNKRKEDLIQHSKVLVNSNNQVSDDLYLIIQEAISKNDEERKL